jgi:response regulator RpfG family c-di-GMP phosphodiesterase
MWSEESAVQNTATLLLVDDEPYITNSLRRVLRHNAYHILTAQSGAQALLLMEDNPVDLVVSDARMPEMDGVEFLGEVRTRWPTCIRILLTGYADIDTTVRAINDGSIYRYISKPWHDTEFCQVIAQSLAYRYAEQERLRLQQLTHEQNEALQQLNEGLERRVRERTAELAATAELLDRANAELQRSYVTATEVFSSLINQRLPKSRQTNQEVIALIRAFCAARKLPKKEAHDLEMAAALYNMGKLTWRDEMIALSPDRMRKEERERYRSYPGIGESLLIGLDPAQDAAVIIRHHQERWDGAGYPDGLAGEAIPWGARLLKLAVDTVELQMGMVLSRQMKREEVLKAIPQYAGRLYDPLLCKQFIEVVAAMIDDQDAQDKSILVIATYALEPGMIMAKNLYSAGGTLLLSEGKSLSQALIEKLQRFEDNESASYKVHVRRPEQEKSDFERSCLE